MIHMHGYKKGQQKIEQENHFSAAQTQNCAYAHFHASDLSTGTVKKTLTVCLKIIKCIWVKLFLMRRTLLHNYIF